MTDRTPKVFVVNEPLRKDEATGEYVRFLPMESAAAFGEVVELTPKGSPPANLAPWMKMIRDGLADWRDGDFLVLVGDQALLAYAGSVIGEIIIDAIREDEEEVGRCERPPVLRLLKWERRLRAYAPLTLREPEDFPRADAESR